MSFTYFGSAADALYEFDVRVLTRLARLYWHSVVFVPLQLDGLVLEEWLWW